MKWYEYNLKILKCQAKHPKHPAKWHRKMGKMGNAAAGTPQAIARRRESKVFRMEPIKSQLEAMLREPSEVSEAVAREVKAIL